MGRPIRLSYRRALHHATLRCNNKEFLFDPNSFSLFLAVLRETAEKFRVPLYNYCLMTNHVHLLFQVGDDKTLSPFMHRLANVFAKRFNKIRERKGHLWEARFLSTIVEPPSFFLRCMAYIDLNPVRARMTSNPADYPWCAHRYILAEDTTHIELHPEYLRLGRDPGERSGAYLRLLAEEAARKPRSLAGVLFVGSQDFTRDLRARFGITIEKRSRYDAVDLGDGLVAVDLRRGGRLPERCRPPQLAD